VTPVASGDLLVGPTRIRQLADGDLFVMRGSSRPVRVDPDTGDQGLYAGCSTSARANPSEVPPISC
jgi:hypothetical protein